MAGVFSEEDEVMGNETKSTGGCLCGAVRFEARGAPLSVGNCHCHNCQQHTGSAFWTGIRFEDAAVTWTGSDLSYYQTSEPISEFEGKVNTMNRGFCPKCGSTVAFRWAESPFPGFTNTVSFGIGAFDDPSKWSPQFHYAEENQLQWTKYNDGVDRYRMKPEEA